MIDKYGRHMLLTKILREKKEALGIYRGQEKKQSFIEMMNNFISELKQYGVDPDALDRIAQELSESAFLRKKLQDVSIIFRSYEIGYFCPPLPENVRYRRHGKRCSACMSARTD